MTDIIEPIPTDLPDAPQGEAEHRDIAVAPADEPVRKPAAVRRTDASYRIDVC